MSLTAREIAGQPEAWSRALAFTDAMGRLIRAPGERLLLIGCGTSAFVAAAVAALREQAGLGLTDWAFASELPAGRDYDRVIALTRSGTTTEVLDALRTVRAPYRGVITAVPRAPAAQLAEEVLTLDFADEASVVQTRFPTVQLLLARAALGEPMGELPRRCAEVLAAPLPADPGAGHAVFLGRGWTVGLAHEAALKVREVAQAWSESYPAMDYRHGPISAADAGTVIWFLGPPPAGLVDDAAATGAEVVSSDLDPLLQLVQAQRFAVALGERQGIDPDRPRHLTRSVILAGAGSAAPGSEPKGDRS